MDRDTWLEQRRQQGVGGSDAPKLFGHYGTPYTLWEEKLGIAAPTPDNWAMRWGRTMEPELRQHYSDLTGREVFMAEGIIVHPKHRFMFFTPDGGTADKRVLQIKTSRSSEGWGEPGTDEIPEHILIQVQHELCVSQFEVADVLLGIYGQEPMLYHVEPDREFHEMLIDAERDFWAHVLAREAPELTGYSDVIARYGKKSVASTVVVTDEVMAAVEILWELKETRDGLDATEEQTKALVMQALGENDTLVTHDGKPLVTWKLGKGSSGIDTDKLKTQYPEVYKEVAKTGEPSRRFLI